jgi:hypothetical protein
LTVGLVIAASAGACRMIPPRKCRPRVDRPKGISGSAKAFTVPAVFHTETWQWQPLPVRPGNGFGMKVARRPCRSATDRTMNLKKACLSAVASASSYSQFISNWPFASSWSFW